MVPFLDTVSYCTESHLLRVAAAVVGRALMSSWPCSNLEATVMLPSSAMLAVMCPQFDALGRSCRSWLH
jgi:hypothetical protein